MHNFLVDWVAGSIEFSNDFFHELRITKAIPIFHYMKSRFNLILRFKIIDAESNQMSFWSWKV